METKRVGRGGMRHAVGAAIGVWAVVSALSMTGQAGQARSVAQGVYTAGQAQRGAQLFTAQCASCHGEKLEGSVGPALVGADFASSWGGRSLAELVEKIQNTMPADAPGGLTQVQAIDLTAYLLQSGRYPAGQGELTAGVLAQITLPAAAAPAAAAPQARAGDLGLTPVANLAQLMRGVTFPNANILFNTQLKDPVADKPKMPIPYDYVLWGRTVYYGWQAVDQAALALEETTPLFMLPGRRCQNGRPVPIAKADYKQYTNDLIDIARELRRAAQSRKVEAVSALAEKLNNTCANCHKAYRDVGTGEGGGLGTDRCRQ